MKRCAFLLILMLSVMTIHAQYVSSIQPQEYDKTQHWGGAFQHLDLLYSLGTTGFGIEAATPLGEDWRLRGGVSYLPWLRQTMHLDVYVGDDQSHFTDVQELMLFEKNYNMKSQVSMSGMLSMFNAKILVDYFPLDDNKKFRITAGLFWGPARISKIITDDASAATLSCIAAYNKMYDETSDDDEILSWGYAGLYMGKYGHDILDDQGDIEHSAGDTYLMKPDDDGHLSIDVRTNSFKPYIGAGYEIGLQKNKDKWKLAIDAGLLFWGGAPSMRVSSDGINLVKDIDNIPGKKGDYIKKVKKLVVYPNISVSLVHHIF